MVVIDGAAYGVCPHHLLPVEYHYYVGYIPKKKALGLSKFHRIFRRIARIPMLQEDLGRKVLEILVKALQPEGAGIVIKGRHSCMIVRGVKQRDGMMVTSSLVGSFRNQSVKDEFLNLVFNLLPGD